ncbi:hypothetical protein ACWDYH_37540 [Nocardia goodfellowii]
MQAVKFAGVPVVLGSALTVVCAVAGFPVPAPHDLVAKNTITLTDADNGKTIEAAVADEITVRLLAYDEPGRRWEWSAPKSSDLSVLNQVRSSPPPSGDASARFAVAAARTAEITAVSSCRGSGQCPGGVRMWKVTVQVD